MPEPWDAELHQYIQQLRSLSGLDLRLRLLGDLRVQVRCGDHLALTEPGDTAQVFHDICLWIDGYAYCNRQVQEALGVTARPRHPLARRWADPIGGHHSRTRRPDMRVKRTFIATFDVESEERDFPTPEELATSLEVVLGNDPDDPYRWGDGVSVYEDADSLLRDIMDGNNEVPAMRDVDGVAIFPFAFSSHDDGVSKPVPVYGRVTVADHGLTISVRGYRDMMDGDPILLHHMDGSLDLVVWADRRQEDPTVTVSLEGARE